MSRRTATADVFDQVCDTDDEQRPAPPVSHWQADDENSATAADDSASEPDVTTPQATGARGRRVGLRTVVTGLLLALSLATSVVFVWQAHTRHQLDAARVMLADIAMRDNRIDEAKAYLEACSPMTRMEEDFQRVATKILAAEERQRGNGRLRLKTANYERGRLHGELLVWPRGRQLSVASMKELAVSFAREKAAADRVEFDANAQRIAELEAGLNRGHALHGPADRTGCVLGLCLGGEEANLGTVDFGGHLGDFLVKRTLPGLSAACKQNEHCRIKFLCSRR